MKVKSESEVAQSCLTLSDAMDCSPQGSSIHGIYRQEYQSGVPLPSTGEALYSQQKQDWELTVVQIVNSLMTNSG